MHLCVTSSSTAWADLLQAAAHPLVTNTAAELCKAATDISCSTNYAWVLCGVLLCCCALCVTSVLCHQRYSELPRYGILFPLHTS